MERLCREAEAWNGTFEDESTLEVEYCQLTGPVATGGGSGRIARRSELYVSLGEERGVDMRAEGSSALETN